MKRLQLTVLTCLVAATLCAQSRVAVVNMVDLVRFHPSRERDRKLMQETEKDFQGKLDKQRDRFEELRQDYESAMKEMRNPALSDKARTEAEDKAMRHRDVLVEAERDLQQEMRKLQNELGDLDTRLLRQVTNDIRELLAKFAEGEGYKMVFDSTTMAYHDPEMDVTDAVLQRMGVDPKVRKEEKNRLDSTLGTEGVRP